MVCAKLFHKLRLRPHGSARYTVWKNSLKIFSLSRAALQSRALRIIKINRYLVIVTVKCDFGKKWHNKKSDFSVKFCVCESEKTAFNFYQDFGLKNPFYYWSMASKDIRVLIFILVLLNYSSKAQGKVKTLLYL